MGLPIKEDNLNNYLKNDLLNDDDLIKNLKNKKFMLVHGSGDDNVHYQQTMLFFKKLVQNDVLFEQVSYPDEQHGLFNVKPHFYHTLDSFWNNCFNLV